MPEPLWTYVTALVYLTGVSPCMAIAQVLPKASHDRLTRMLTGNWSAHTPLDLALRTLCQVTGGSLIVDDTVVDKSSATWLEETAWVWSSTRQRAVFGIPPVLLVWTAGQVRIPVAFRVWKPGGPSQFDLALELLSDARNQLRGKPRFVLFDSWYPAKKVLQRSRDDGWDCVCQLKKNRRFERVPVPGYRRDPSWHAVGFLSGRIKVLVVRHRRTYSATTRLSLTALEVRAIDKRRHAIEEVFTGRKSELSLEACPAGDKQSAAEASTTTEGVHAHHRGLCWVADLIWQRERMDQGMTLRQLSRKLIVTGVKAALPSLKRVRMAA